MGLSQYRESLGPIEDSMGVPKPVVKPLLPAPMPQPRAIGVPAPPTTEMPKDGGAVRIGAGAPYADLGVEGDYYINGQTGDIYKKSQGTYLITGSARQGSIAGGAGREGPPGAKGADGAQGPPGPQGPPGADGGGSSRIAFASLPAPGTAGKVYYFTDSPYMARDNGSSYNYYYEGFPVTPLSIAGWTGFATPTTDTTDGVVTMTNLVSGGTQLRGYLRGSYPAQPFTLIVGVRPLFNIAGSVTNLAVIGFTVSDGTKHKICVYSNFQFNTAGGPTTFFVGKYNSPTSAVSGTDVSNLNFTNEVVWLKLVDSGGNQTFSFSYNKKTWVQILSEARTTHLTPSDIGIVMTSQGGTPSFNQGGEIVSWEIT